MSSETVLELGMVLELGSSFKLRGTSVYAVAMNELQINIGTVAPKEVNWFCATSKAETLQNAKAVVYLGNDKFGIKQLTPTMQEFNLLKEDDKEEIIQNYIENYLD